ncbi:aquaporin-like protein [Phlegmacium glaucopus]|nr:aquaporin-like protein [Phlegmacium glaucopus]
MPTLLRDVFPRTSVLAAWERQRNKKEVHWAMECFAEMLGVFIYCYLGIGATAGFVLGTLLKQVGLSSILQIGLAYALGIVLALTVCFTTSGAHISPGVTIAFVVFKGFPPLKAARYIAAQIVGAIIACALVYNQWKVLIVDAEELLMAAGPAVYAATQFTPNGPAGIFGLYMLPGQTLARAFLNEFVNCTLLGIVIWSTLDPTNGLVTPLTSPVIVGIGYAAAIWGFAVPAVSLNTARDVGGRIFAVAIWGSAANGGTYAAIAALTNIPAILFAAYIYEVFLTDSDRVVTNAQLEFFQYLNGHGRLHHGNGNHSDSSSQEKTDALEHIEQSRV